MNGREWQTNKGEPTGPPSFIFEPWRGARVGSNRCPILRPGYRSLAQNEISTKERQLERCDGVDSLSMTANPHGFRPARRVPLPWLLLRRNSDSGAAGMSVGRSNWVLRCRAKRARTRTAVQVRETPRRDGLRHGRTKKRTTDGTSQTNP